MLDPRNPNELVVINHLKYLTRSYEGLTDLISKSKQRVKALNPEIDPKHDGMLYGEGRGEGLESVKTRVRNKLAKELEFFPVWSEWMKGIHGVGPYIGSSLVILYYYRFAPACKKCRSDLLKQEGTYWCPTCEKSVKGDGLSVFNVRTKDFPNISKWWAYLGMHCDETGRKPKRKAGVQMNWSPLGRLMGFYIGEGFNKCKPDHLYKQFLEERRKKRMKTHPEAPQFHRARMAQNETAKLFLAHFWTVARTLDGLPVTRPYAGAIMGHTGIVDPFYFDLKEKAA